MRLRYNRQLTATRQITLNPMADNLLYICPGEIDTAPADIPALTAALQRIGFLGDTLDFHGAEHFRPGEEFLSLITFLGCSPVIAMGEPGKTGEEFCHIALDGPLERPRFINGQNTKIPRCPGCGHRFEDWRERVEQWQRQPAQHFECPGCTRSLDATSLRWRKCAGFGRFFIQVWGIFESEAVPNPNLLSVLQEQTGSPWLHFYIQRS